MKRKERDLKIVKYLCTPVGTTKTGKSIYPTYEDASNKFGLHATQIFRIKKEYVGPDIDGIRNLPEGVTP